MWPVTDAPEQWRLLPFCCTVHSSHSSRLTPINVVTLSVKLNSSPSKLTSPAWLFSFQKVNACCCAVSICLADVLTSPWRCCRLSSSSRSLSTVYLSSTSYGENKPNSSIYSHHCILNIKGVLQTTLDWITDKKRERNVLFNDALNTFYLRLYGVRHMVKDHSDSEKGNPLPPHRLLLSINSKGSFICTIPQTG